VRRSQGRSGPGCAGSCCCSGALRAAEPGTGPTSWAAHEWSSWGAVAASAAPATSRVARPRQAPLPPSPTPHEQRNVAGFTAKRYAYHTAMRQYTPAPRAQNHTGELTAAFMKQKQPRRGARLRPRRCGARGGLAARPPAAEGGGTAAIRCGILLALARAAQTKGVEREGGAPQKRGKRRGGGKRRALRRVRRASPIQKTRPAAVGRVWGGKGGRSFLSCVCEAGAFAVPWAPRRA
jgi:hypothetical protein